jgi:hypothetical protein
MPVDSSASRCLLQRMTSLIQRCLRQFARCFRPMSVSCLFLLPLLVLGLNLTALQGQESKDQGSKLAVGLQNTNDASFDALVAPLLSRRCLSCHDATSKKGGLDLTSEATMIAGGESGPAIKAGLPDESLLLQRVISGEMPPKERLTADEQAILQQWITKGGTWGTDPIDPYRFSTDVRGGYDWWSLQPISTHEPPPVRDRKWPRNEIDQFTLAKLESHGLMPAEPADGRTLLRRLYLDLIGLPPVLSTTNGRMTEELLGLEINLQTIGTQSKEYAAVVDQLLASPHYGERWARHWLDVIRFGESQGFERNRIRDNAWRYRDWVIEAFNRDMPYDEFVRQQIAGDVLYPDDLDALLATGFLVCGTWDQVGHKEGSAEMQMAVRQDHIEDMVGALGQTFLGLTTNCARCHDHKFDPITQREYYQLAAAIGGVTQEENERTGITARSSTDSRAEVQQNEQRESSVSFSGTAHVIIPKQPPTFHVLDRGDYRKPLDVVSAGAIQSVSRDTSSADFGLKPDAPEAERRVALAKWITDARNPLTSRVLVNRLWHYHFGRGIVDTPSDFGFAGGRPSHPELLDWMAHRFVEGGWKIKDLHRLIVTSATWRQASNVRHPRAQEIDADNRWLWRANARRLDGESSRDAMLAVCGQLNRKLGGPSYRDIKVSGGVMGSNAEFTEPTGEFSESTCRRTIYRLWARSGNHPLLESLDCADPSVAAPRRAQTITPIQSLTLLNSSFVEHCAKHLADRVRREAGEETSLQIDRLYQWTLGRSPKPEELQRTRALAEKHGLDQLALVLLNTNEFLFVE